MNVKVIHLGKTFKKQFEALPVEIKKKALLAETLFIKNPFHPSLRLHKLKGRMRGFWSISINRKYRIIFNPLGGGEFVYTNIGKHSIYED